MAPISPSRPPRWTDLDDPDDGDLPRVGPDVDPPTDSDLDPPRDPDGQFGRGGFGGSQDWRDRVDELRGRLGLDIRLLAWVVVAVVAAGAAAWLLRPAPTPFEETLPRASTEEVGPGGAPSAEAAGAPAGGAGAAPPSGATTTSVLTEVVAYAAGAVNRPGVYRLDPTARVDDLVRAAGGLAPDADPARINLAAPLVDGARVYVPHIGEQAPPQVAGPDVAAPPAGGVGEEAGSEDGPGALININTASDSELEELPGVGPAIAGAIVTFRTENGGFSSVDELLDVRGIGDAKMAEIAPLVTV